MIYVSDACIVPSSTYCHSKGRTAKTSHIPIDIKQQRSYIYPVRHGIACTMKGAYSIASRDLGVSNRDSTRHTMFLISLRLHCPETYQYVVNTTLIPSDLSPHRKRSPKGVIFTGRFRTYDFERSAWSLRWNESRAAKKCSQYMVHQQTTNGVAQQLARGQWIAHDVSSAMPRHFRTPTSPTLLLPSPLHPPHAYLHVLCLPRCCSKDDKDMDGSAVCVYMEGSRPILCELQSLVTYSRVPSPRRTSGFPTLAFLVKRCCLFVNLLRFS